MQKSKLISIIVPMYNETSNLLVLQERLTTVMDALAYNWEVICINDGSRDNTLAQLIGIHRSDPRFKIIDFSRNFGKEAALTAGIAMAQGDAIIPFDADLQDPPEYIPQLVDQWEKGYEVVNAVREARTGETRLKRFTAALFYRVINKLSKVNVPKDTGDFRLLSRTAVEVLLELPERRRFMKGLFSWVGFRTTTITYKRAPRYAGATKWNYWKLWNFALEGIVSFSQVPLQIASYLGLLIALVSFLYGTNLLIKTWLYGNPVPGYPSLMVAILFIGGVQLIALGVIGEYLGRVYDEVKQRPLYVVREKWW